MSSGQARSLCSGALPRKPGDGFSFRRGRPKLDATSECGAEARWTVSWTSTRGSRQSETRRPAPSALSPHGLRGFEKGT